MDDLGVPTREDVNLPTPTKTKGLNIFCWMFHWNCWDVPVKLVWWKPAKCGNRVFHWFFSSASRLNYSGLRRPKPWMKWWNEIAGGLSWFVTHAHGPHVLISMSGLHRLIKSWKPNQFGLPYMVLHVASIPFGNYVKIYNVWICVLLALKTYNPCTHAAHRMSKKRVRVSLGKREQKMREGTPANCTVNHWSFKGLKERNLVGVFFTKITMSEVSHKIANWSTLTFLFTSDLQESYSKTKEQNQNNQSLTTEKLLQTPNLRQTFDNLDKQANRGPVDK